MKTYLVIALAVLTTICMAPTSHAYTILGSAPMGSTVLDFESFSAGDTVNSIGDVSFVTVNGTGSPTIDNNESGGGLGIHGGPGDGTIYTSINQDAPLGVVFNNGASSAGGTYIDVAPFIGRGFFYDIYDTLIATFILDEAVDFWGLMADPGDAAIGSILFDSSGGYVGTTFGADVSESYTVDNLFYTPAAPVPEPSTFILLGSGLAGLAWFSRKRKKA